MDPQVPVARCMQPSLKRNWVNVADACFENLDYIFSGKKQCASHAPVAISVSRNLVMYEEGGYGPVI